MNETNRQPSITQGLPGQAQRASIEQEMDLKFPNFELLVTAISANISTSGMFIQTAEPAPVGTTLSFRFRIEDWSPIHGTARVVWNREHDEATDRPAGMGVKFVDVDAQSRRMIRYLVDKHTETGGEPFELGHQDESSSDHGNGTSTTSTNSLAPGPQSNRMLWGVGALCMAIAIGLGLWFQLTRPPAPDESNPPRMVVGEQTGVSSPVQAPSAEESVASVAEPGDRLAEEAIRRLVSDWSAAWESRQADTLISLYSREFEPAGRETRSQWESRIEREMSNATFIRMAISALEISAPTDSQGEASFFQSIRSDQRDDTIRTSLEVVREGDGWKIVRQTITR